MATKKVKVGIIGVGNVASGLIEGIEYYKCNPNDTVGIMTNKVGGYGVRDIEISSAFDIDIKKVGKSLDKAVYESNNMVNWIKIPKSKVIVVQSPIYDSLGYYLSKVVTPAPKRPDLELRKRVIKELNNTETEVLVNCLPVGSNLATRFWAQVALDTGISFVNAIPSFIASDSKWAAKFKKKNIPIIGDDIKGMLGATILHRALVKMAIDRHTKLIDTYQMNVAGNTDFKNMQEETRLKSKLESKKESINSVIDKPLDDEHLYAGPSGVIPFLGNEKRAFIYLRGKLWANNTYEIRTELDVDDKACAGAILAEAVRIVKSASERKIGGPLMAPSAYLMKHPPKSIDDYKGKMLYEQFLDEINS